MSTPIAPHTPPGLTAREVEQGMRLNVISGSLGMVWMVVAIGMPLPLLMDAVQASGLQLGLLSAAWQLAMLAQLPSALLVEHLRRRKPVWAVVSFLHRGLWAVPAALPWLLPQRRGLWPEVIILALATSNFLGQAGTGPWQSWMADLLPPARAGRFWGTRQRALSAAMVGGAFAFGLVLDAFSTTARPFVGFQIVFAAAALFGSSDIFLHCFVPEPSLHLHPASEPIWKRLLRPLRDRDFRLLTLGMGVWTGAQAMVGYTIGLPGFFAMAYVKETFGATYSEASWIFIASGLGAVLWAPRIGRWVDQVGGRRVLSRLMLAGPGTMFAWLFVSKARWPIPGSAASVPEAVLFLCVVSLVLGAIYASAYLCQIRLTQAHTRPEGRTLAMGVHWSLCGLLASLGPLAAGWIKDHLAGRTLVLGFAGGAPMSYFQLLVLLHALLCWGVALPLIRRIR